MHPKTPKLAESTNSENQITSHWDILRAYPQIETSWGNKEDTKKQSGTTTTTTPHYTTRPLIARLHLGGDHALQMAHVALAWMSRCESSFIIFLIIIEDTNKAHHGLITPRRRPRPSSTHSRAKSFVFIILNTEK